MKTKQMQLAKYCLILPFLIQKTKCSFIAGLLKDVSHKDPSIEKYGELFLLVTIGLFIGILGLRYVNACVFLVTAIALDSSFNELFQYFQEICQKKEDFFIYFPRDGIKEVLETVNKYPNTKAIVFLILSVVISSFIVSIIRGINILGFCLAGLYMYKEIFGAKRLVSIGLKDNTYVNIVIFLILLYILWLIFQKIPKLLFAGFFAFVGPLLFISGIELGMNVNWGFSKIIADWNTPTNYTEALNQNIAFFFICGACFIIQLTMNRRKSKN